MDSININFGTASITDSTFAIGKDNRINNIPSNASCLSILQDAFASASNKLTDRPDYQKVIDEASKIADTGDKKNLVDFLKKNAGTFASQIVIGALGETAAGIILKLICQ